MKQLLDAIATGRPRHAGLALLALLVAGSAGAAARPEATPDPALEPLRRETALLRRELELASGKAFYLRLDAGRGRLALMLGGVVLDDYGLESVEQGVPRVVFVPRRPSADWDLRAFTAGRLEPERERDRLEIVAPTPEASTGDTAAASASPSPPAIPKTAEESYSVPSRYRVVFAEGVSLEVRAAGAARNRSLWQRAGDGLGLAAADWRAALARRAAERVRLRVRMSGDDAASLYRSLPPDVNLLVVGLPLR